MRSIAVAAVLLSLAGPAYAEPPLRARVPVKVLPPMVGNVVNSKTIFLNRCTGGCKITVGYTDSRKNTSQIATRNSTLSAFSYGDTAWNGVVSCVKNVMSRFNVTVTDVDPGPMVDHFEAMVAGRPEDIGLGPGFGGIAESSCSAIGTCTKYLPNTIVYAFAAVYSGYANKVNEICATAAQELAHSWGLDHVTDPTDPLTYAQSFTGIRQFKDGVKCGSDCVGGVSAQPFSIPCNTAGEHTCVSTGTATQNDVQTLIALFGPAGAQAPMLSVTNPANGSTQSPGFEITANCTSADGVQEVALSIDGVPKATLTVPPFTFMAPATIPEGPHRVSVLCASTKQAITIVNADVVVGTPCVNGGCNAAGYICFDGACIAGPDATGGVGATCNNNADCISDICASDGTSSSCVIPCDLDAKHCPDGFGCIEDGAGGGVCWLGADSGGCCDTSGSNGAGSMLLALGIAATFVTRRRRRSN
jgi:hypothetical protein